MKTRALVALAFVDLLFTRAPAQSVLFDFNNAPDHTSLPLDLTVDGVTAHFSATGQGFSIQRADTMGFTPAGFSGLCIYPNSVFAADLQVTFSRTLTDLSILYAPQELGGGGSAVTARCGDAPAAPPGPPSKPLVAGQGSVFKQALKETAALDS